MSNLPPEEMTAKPLSQRAVVGPAERPKLVQELHDKIDDLEARAAANINSLDDDLASVWEVVQLMLMLQGALVNAIRAITEDPGSPHAGAARAREIMEEAYGPDEGPEDDGVVQQPAGDQSGDT